jgi:hypothetical protein
MAPPTKPLRFEMQQVVCALGGRNIGDLSLPIALLYLIALEGRR